MLNGIEVTLTSEQEHQLSTRIAIKLETTRIPTGSRCVGCDKHLEENEMSLRGYATGKELNLCRKCTATVNTPAVMDKMMDMELDSIANI